MFARCFTGLIKYSVKSVLALKSVSLVRQMIFASREALKSSSFNANYTLAIFYAALISLLTCWLKLVTLVCPAPLCIKTKWKEMVPTILIKAEINF